VINPGCLIWLIGFALYAVLHSWSANGAFAVLGLAIALGFVVSARQPWARKEHLVHGHREGAADPLEFRVLTNARAAPIDRPYGKRKRFSSRDEPELLTRWVSQNLGLAAVLQHAGLVVYRESESDARDTESALHTLLDPLFAESVTTVVERWNDELEVWQSPEQAGGDKATLAALSWEVRIRCSDQNTAFVAAARIRREGEVMVGVSSRNVLIGAVDEASARAIATRLSELDGVDASVRPMNPLRRRRLRGSLYDRQRGRKEPPAGWLSYDEPAAV
jgi:hypothetical protein